MQSDHSHAHVATALVTIVALVIGLAIGGVYFGVLGQKKPVTITETSLVPAGTKTVEKTKVSTVTIIKEAKQGGVETNTSALEASWEKVERLASLFSAERRSPGIYAPVTTAPTVTATVVGREPLEPQQIAKQVEELSSRLGSVRLPGGEKLYYSGTNVQVAGVDEPDIVKTNGTHIFVASNNFLEVYKAYPANELSLQERIDVAKMVEKLAGKEYLAVVSGNHTQVIGVIKHSIRIVGLLVEGKDAIVLATESRWPGPLEPRTWVLLVRDGKVLHTAAIPGYFRDARFSNNSLIIVTLLGQVFRPIILLEKGTAVVPAPIIAGIPTSQAIVTAINTSSWSTASASFIGATTSTLYVTSSGDIYLVAPGSIKQLEKLGNMSKEEAEKLVNRIRYSSYYENSTILHLRVAKGPSLVLVAEGTVPGRVWRQWMIDVYNGTLRIVTEHWGVKGVIVSLYVLDAETLKPIGRLENVAVNERVHAVRFLGNTLYLVTYRNIDPLFAIDLSNPAKPVVLGFLKSPGFDEYLHPLTKNLLIGVGRDERQVRVTLYRIKSDRTVEIVDRVYIGDKEALYSWSPVLNPVEGHKAFTLDPLHGYVLIPVTEQRPYKPIWGVAVIKLEAINTTKPLMKLVTLLQHQYAERSIFIDDAIYTIAPRNPVERIIAFSAKTLKKIASAPGPVKAKIADIVENPEKYSNAAVVLKGVSRGWSGLDYPPPVSRSDWVLDDGTGKIYVAAYTPYYYGKTTIPKPGTEVTVIGIVRIAGNGHPYIIPYIIKQA